MRKWTDRYWYALWPEQITALFSELIFYWRFPCRRKSKVFNCIHKSLLILYIFSLIIELITILELQMTPLLNTPGSSQLDQSYLQFYWTSQPLHMNTWHALQWSEHSRDSKLIQGWTYPQELEVLYILPLKYFSCQSM